ncbi:MAG: PD40 domain-containing protein [Verrucomicrobia bacterium]|nr:PD40 domain-containing protein [Verrucomicrobiota bacterium]
MKTKTKFLVACLLGFVFLSHANAQSPTDSNEAAHQRVAAKVERVMETVQEWEHSGRDSSVIGKTMREKVRPLLEAGKFAEADVELDRVFAQLDNAEKSTESPTAPKAAPHPLREIIVSYADETSKLQLYRLNEDGSARRRITDGTHDCTMPAWSPDGKKIVYVQEGAELWLSDPDGKNPKMLEGSGLKMAPAWLPDSKHIVWTEVTSGNSPFQTGQLNFMNTETRQFRRLFSDPEQVKFSNMMAVVSPAGTKVAFTSNRSGHYRIWVSNLDGSDASPLSPEAADVDETLQLPIDQKVPSWSPDGKWIAHWEGVEMSHLSLFTGKADHQRDMLIGGTWNVWVVGSDGKNKRKAGRGDDPNWSPDGFVTRSFPDKGGANVMIEMKDGWKELPIIPAKMPRYGRFTWKPETDPSLPSKPTAYNIPNQRAAAEPTGGRIAFPGRDQQGRQQLFTIRIDGTDRRQLTFENNNSMPSWSPDGARLVCVSRTPAPNLTIMDEDGGNKRTLVLGDAPDWGPNGQIAYTSADQTGHTRPTPGRQPAEIWVVDAKGGGTPRQVTSGGNHGGRVHPSWSPDGKRLVFMQLTHQDPATDDTSNGCPALPVRAELWIIDADGAHPRLLTTTGFSNHDASGQLINSANDANAPDWSPAGDVITFWSGQEGCYGQVWRINADGSGRTQLTKAPIPSHNDDPAWSPDGRRILFTTDRNGRPETWVMDADGSHPRFLTASKPGPGPGDAAWQPVRR